MGLFNAKQDRAERVPPSALHMASGVLRPALYDMQDYIPGCGPKDEFDMMIDNMQDSLVGSYYNARTQSKIAGTLFERHELKRDRKVIYEVRERFQALVTKLHDKFRVPHYVSCEIREPGLTARTQANTLPRRKGEYRKGSYDHRNTIRLPRLLYSNPAWTHNNGR